jgi:hypothetical protein
MYYGHENYVFLSTERMEALLETMEILANPAAMEAIRAFEACGQGYRPLSECLDDT